MSTSASIRHLRRRPAIGMAAAVISILLAACGGGGATSSEPAQPTAASSAASVSAEPSEAAAPSAKPIASAVAVELCLPAEMRTAIEELRDGNFEPDVAFSDIADAVEELDVSGLDDPSFAELLRDDLVEKLRDPEDLGGIGRAAAGFSSEVLEDVEEC